MKNKSLKYPAFFVITGSYDNPTSRAYLYVRVMGSDLRFTVSALIFSQKQFDDIIGKVIIINQIIDDCASVRVTQDNTKICRFGNPYDGSKFWGSESNLILTGQYVDKIVEDDGYELYVIDTVFPLIFGYTSGEGDLGSIGDWIELELMLEVGFDKVTTAEDWISINPEQR